MSGTAEKRHPIQVVSRQTGLSTELLRIWEKRYRVVEPGRTPNNRRVYSDRDIERLRLLRRATQQGWRISEVSGFGDEEIQSMLGRSAPAEPAPSPTRRETAEGTEAIIDKCIRAVVDLDSAGLERILTRARLTMDYATLIEELLAPLMRRIGDGWIDEEILIHQEHMASATVRQMLGRLISESPVEDSAPTVVVTTPAGQLHDIGALFVAVIAIAEGWRVLFLGANLPARDIAQAVVESKASAVALSIVGRTDDTSLGGELRELGSRLPAHVELLVGGNEAIHWAQDVKEVGGRVLTDTRGVQAALADLAH